MENPAQKELTDKEIQIAQIKSECVKIASKYSYSFGDIIKQTKELFGLIEIN
jgi:hypothetical protein